MTLTMLREDALSTTSAGFALRLALPWIRSMPLSSVTELAVSVDGAPALVDVSVGGRRVRPVDLGAEKGWWFIQDRLPLTGRGALSTGEHEVTVSFALVVPYLQAAPGAPLILPFHEAQRLTLDAVASVPAVARDVV